MTETVIVGLVALAAITVVGVAQYRAWGTWRRRARRRQALEKLLTTGVAVRPASQPRSARPSNPVDRLALWLRRSNATRRAMSALVALLVVVAIAIIAYPLLTDLYTNRLQNHLRHQLGTAALRQSYQAHAVKVGDALTRIKIPAIGVDVVVVEGTTASALRAGAGHYVQTPLPCAVGNVGIAGHRTTYGKPFHDLNKLHPGDKVVLETPVGECTYLLDKQPFSVRPTDVGVLNPDPAHPSTLTLTTCDPPGSAAKRLIVQAALDPSASKKVVP